MYRINSLKQKKRLPNDTDINRKCNARCRRLRNTKKCKPFVVEELSQNKNGTKMKIELNGIWRGTKMEDGEDANFSS